MPQFETHITLAIQDDLTAQHVNVWATSQGWKWTQIVLSCGRHPIQPMITLWGHETLEANLEQANQAKQSLAGFGVGINRIKIERALEQTEANFELSVNQYFEHHVKLLLRSDADHVAVRRIAIQHGSYLSCNARRVRHDGAEERFVTMREFKANYADARKSFQNLLGDFQQQDLNVLEIESEVVVYDSNLDLDRGWI